VLGSVRRQLGKGVKVLFESCAAGSYTFGNELAVLDGKFVELSVFRRTLMLQVANRDEMMLAGNAHRETV
jgi:hypothetical protein